jgi:hypothetical protein
MVRCEYRLGEVPRPTHYRLFREDRPPDGQLKELTHQRQRVDETADSGAGLIKR